ncbi:phosphotransferase enzyme family-domain-containing protein [Fusarium sp. MPI-SDFR-AT-0072]|nr:phosphotransferase enzyme family-domain-containing protein [Fusarium sp. MPI-SDFR-AT-0072]
MGTPADHLPLPHLGGCDQRTFAGLAPASSDCHQQSKNDCTSRGHYELVLRVSGNHLPNIKTKNEIGVMTWLSKNTTIPLPEVISYDASTDNPIGHEYTLLSHIQGVTLSDVYDRLSDEQMNQILDQLIDFLTQPQAHPWDGIEGLTLDDQGEVQLGPVVDETFWQGPDIEALWPEGETYIRLIQTHDKLAFMRDTIARLEAFVVALPKHANELNNLKLRLAHKDLHFANMIFDPCFGKITGILDWEFAGVVPYPQWNPRSSFLWNGIDTPESLHEKYRLLEVFKQRCKEKGCTLFEETEYTSPLQEDMQRAVDFLRAMVEVSPGGQRQERVQGWKDMVLENIAKFGA